MQAGSKKSLPNPEIFIYLCYKKSSKQMALRIRKDGRILCAAMHPPQNGDTYIDDGLHYEMSVIHKVIASEPHEKHQISGEWWWTGNIPKGVKVSEFYLKSKKVPKLLK